MVIENDVKAIQQHLLDQAKLQSEIVQELREIKQAVKTLTDNLNRAIDMFARRP